MHPTITTLMTTLRHSAIWLLFCLAGATELRAQAYPTGERLFPAAAVVNVKTQYGAKGDGATDDTQAIQRAIFENHGKTLYFPKGTYLVSNRLEARKENGNFRGEFRFYGQSRTQTIIKLKDKSPGYGDPNRPKAVLFTTSNNFGGDPNASGYLQLGEGNEAYGNYIENLTVEIGQENAGAIAIDYLANNRGAIRDVVLRGAGKVGVSMERRWPGPCLLKNVQIEGFDYGIRTTGVQYGITLEHISLLNQKVVGIYNNENALSIRRLLSNNRVPALENFSGFGLITLVEATLQGGANDRVALENKGGFFLRNVRTEGYQAALRHNGKVMPGADIRELVSSRVNRVFATDTLSLNLTMEETPEFHDSNLANWANVEDYGAKGTDATGGVDWHDDTDAIQRALDAGKTTVFFPAGHFLVSRTLRVPAGVRKIMGAKTDVSPAWGAFNDAARPQAFFLVEADGPQPLIIQGLSITRLHSGVTSTGLVSFKQTAARPLVLVDVVTMGEGYAGYQSGPGTGPLFLENTIIIKVFLDYPQRVWARQLNAETLSMGSITRIINNAARLWILGIKTEGGGTVIETNQNGETELLGGNLYLEMPTMPAGTVAFRNNGGKVTLTYATTSYSNNDYPAHIREKRADRTGDLAAADIRQRGMGRMVPLYAGYEGTPQCTQAGKVVSYTLINADTDQPVAGYETLVDGAVLRLSDLPTRRLNIRANVNPAISGSVRFDYDATVAHAVESSVPYALAGNLGNDYAAWTPTAGPHQLVATPFCEAAAKGAAGTPLTISFTVEDREPDDKQAPTVPDALSSPGQTVSSIDLTWNAATDNVKVTKYILYQNGAPIATADGTTTRFLVEGLRASTSYRFTEAAGDAAGNDSAVSSELAVSTKTPADTQAPTAPGTLSSPEQTTFSISLTWEAATDNVGVITFRVYEAVEEIGISYGTT
ncbi:MAG: hypothetical protein H7Z75_02570, partial [Ferruginibacter sp.]|nr:hypothetical protein [Cytophagales bacterium]